MQSVVMSVDNALLFTASLGAQDHCIRVWRLPPPQQGPEAGEGQQQAAGSPQASAQPSQPTLLCTLRGHTASVLALALCPDGSLLFSGSHDYTVRVWSTADWSCVRELRGHGGGVRALAVSPDGSLVYSAAGDNTLRVRTEPRMCNVLKFHVQGCHVG